MTIPRFIPTLLLSVSLLACKYKMPVIDCHDFGLSTQNSPQANGEALDSVCRYVAVHPGTMIEVRKGVYRIRRETGNQIWFKDCRDIILNGNGAEFIFLETESKQGGSFIRIENTENFRLHDLVIDWDWDISPLSVVGRVDSVNNEGIIFKLLHGGIRTLPPIHMGREWDISANCRSLEGFSLYTGYSDGAEMIDEEHIFVKMKNPSALRESDVGKYCNIRFYHNYFAGGVYVTGSRNVTLERVTIYSCPETAFSCYATTGLTIAECTVAPRPDSRHFYSSHSAGELHNSFGKIVYRNNRIVYSYDDGLHISSGFVPPYMERKGDDLCQINCQYLQYYFLKDVIRMGDTMEFYDANFCPTGFTARVEKAEWIHGVRNHPAPSDCLLTFDRIIPDSLLESHYLFNLALTDVSYLIEDNEFAYNGCHGIHAGLPNGLIQGNRFYRTAYPPLNMTLVLRWGRWVIGPGPSNITIRNNVFDECDIVRRQPACLFVGAGVDPQNGNFTPVPYTAVNNVKITGNTIRNSDMPALGVWSVKNVLIRGNRFENISRNPVTALQDKGAVFVLYAQDVTLRNNTLIQPQELKHKSLVIDHETTTGVSVKKWKER